MTGRVRPSRALRTIRRLPLGRRLVLRLYNRLLMHLAPRRRVTTYFGAMMDCDARDMIQATITHFGAWEPGMSALVEEMVQPGSVAVDVGANIGYYTLLLAKMVGPEGSVVAIEALPKLAARVEQHLRANSVGNARVVNAAVSAGFEPVTMYEAPGTNIGMSTTNSELGFAIGATVPGRPLLDILSDDEIRRTSVIKIDIEGAELPVARDILDALDRFPPQLAIFVEADIAKNPEWATLLEKFEAAGYEAWRLSNNYDWVEMMERQDCQPELLAGQLAGVIDLLLVRPEYRPPSIRA